MDRTSNYFEPVMITGIAPADFAPIDPFAVMRNISGYDKPAQMSLTKTDVNDIVERRLSELRIYVLESDITNAQNSVKSVVELASF